MEADGVCGSVSVEVRHMRKIKNINLKELENIEFLLKKDIDRNRIASIIGCSKTTVGRVERGEHHLQGKMPEPIEEKSVPVEYKTEQVEPAPEQLPKETTDYFEFKVDEKLDRIICLLGAILDRGGK